MCYEDEVIERYYSVSLKYRSEEGWGTRAASDGTWRSDSGAVSLGHSFAEAINGSLRNLRSSMIYRDYRDLVEGVSELWYELENEERAKRESENPPQNGAKS